MIDPTPLFGGFAIAVVALGLCLASLALWLLRRGWWPRRLGEEPHCRGCGYSAVANQSGTCPECGRALTPRNLVLGVRRRRGGVAAAGLCAALLALACFGGAASPAVRRIDWYHFRPTSWVLKDLNTNTPHAWSELQRRHATGGLSAAQESDWEAWMLANLVIPQRSGSMPIWAELVGRASARPRQMSTPHRDAWVRRLLAELGPPSPGAADEAWAELQRLEDLGDLSPADAAARVDRALAAQSRPGPIPPLTRSMLDWLGQRCVQHALTPEQERRFFDGMMTLRLEVRPTVGPEDRVPFLIVKCGKGPQGWWELMGCDAVFVDDRPMPPAGGRASGDVGNGSFGSSISPQPLGRHRLRVRLQTGIDSHRHEFGEPADKLLFDQTRELTADFEVAAERPPVRFVQAPDAIALARCLRADQFERHSQGFSALDGELYYEPLPVNVAFSVFAHAGGVEFRLGSLAERAGGGSGTVGMMARKVPAGIPLASIDLILRSDDAVARDTVDLNDIWKGEILLPNVPVKEPATQPARR